MYALCREIQSTVRNQRRLHGCWLEILFTTVMKYIIKMSSYRLLLFPQFPAQFFENRMLRFLTWISASFLYSRVLIIAKMREIFAFCSFQKGKEFPFSSCWIGIVVCFSCFHSRLVCAFLHPRSSHFSGQNKHAANRSHSTERSSCSQKSDFFCVWMGQLKTCYGPNTRETGNNPTNWRKNRQRERMASTRVRKHTLKHAFTTHSIHTSKNEERMEKRTAKRICSSVFINK